MSWTWAKHIHWWVANLPSVLAVVGAALAGAMALLWVVSLWLRDASIVDPFWGPAFALAAWVAFAASGGALTGRPLLVLALVSIWACRLAAHLLLRRRGNGEDFRYRAMRERHGARFPFTSLFTVFALQGALAWVIAFPLVAAVAARGQAPLGPLDALAAALWLAGFATEAAADLQLSRFKRAPESRGRVLDTGVWRFSRHPNYFGDAVQWWAFWLLALASGAGWTAFSPALMTFLLLRVSGVSLLEKDIADRRPAYRDYVARTSAFVPWPPRRPGGGGP